MKLADVVADIDEELSFDPETKFVIAFSSQGAKEAFQEFLVKLGVLFPHADTEEEKFEALATALFPDT